MHDRVPPLVPRVPAPLPGDGVRPVRGRGNAAVPLQRLRAIEHRRQCIETRPAAHSLTNGRRVVTQRSDVVHDQSFGTPGRSERKSQLGSTVVRKYTRVGLALTLSTISLP